MTIHHHAQRDLRRAALLVACGLVGCTADASDGRTRLVQQFVACGLATAGELRVERILEVPDACYLDCYARASCGELEGAACLTSTSLRSACDAECSHRCSDGALIALEAVCDGFAECGDGSDELDCPTFRCASGAVIAARLRCNNHPDCEDGSDEHECPTPSCDVPEAPWFCERVCDDGEVVRGAPRCDGIAQCGDGSDEAGCAALRCGE